MSRDSRDSRVVVVGRLQQRTWTAGDGNARSVVEVVVQDRGAREIRRRQLRQRLGGRLAGCSESVMGQPSLLAAWS